MGAGHNVRFGSNCDMRAEAGDVRLAPGSGTESRKADLGQGMSAKRLITEVAGQWCHFRFVPKAEIRAVPFSVDSLIDDD